MFRKDETIKMKRRKIVLGAICVVLLSIIVMISIFQFVFPLSYEFVEAKTFKYIGDDYAGVIETEYNEAKEGLRSDIQLLTTKDFDFSDSNNFTQIVLWYEVKNRSFLDINNIEFYVEDVGEYVDRFMYKTDAVVTQSADANESTTIRFDIYMFTEGLSESQIVQAVEELTINLQFIQNFTGNHSQGISIPNDLTFIENNVL